MTVEVVTQGGSKPNFAYFADTFDRVDQPFVVGDSWVYSTLQGEATVSSANQLAGAVNVAGAPGELIFLNTTMAPCPTFLFYPIRTRNDFVYGRKQFAELVYRSATNAVNQIGIGPSCLCDINKGNAYQLIINNNGAGIQWRLARYVLGVFTVLIGFTAASFNKVYRLEAIPGTPNDLTVFEDGVQVGHTTDASFTGLGIPAMIASGILGNNMHMSNWKSGSLPQVRTAANFIQS